MSILVYGKPISMWSTEDLSDKLNEIVCTQGTPADIAVLAESVARLLSAHPTLTISDHYVAPEARVEEAVSAELTAEGIEDLLVKGGELTWTQNGEEYTHYISRPYVEGEINRRIMEAHSRGRLAGLEEAAKACDDFRGQTNLEYVTARDLAEAIRALKTAPKE